MPIPSVDVIIRFRNEEFWLKKLRRKFESLKGVEIHLYGVDNNSNDGSKKIFKSFNNKNLKSIHYQNIAQYTPGAALNLGIDKGSSEFILLLSAHCIPKDDYHIAHLHRELCKEDARCAGIYGRQLPLPCSGAQNTVDLTLTYPNEDRILRRTPLFNNANSMIRRDVYKKQHFDPTLTNLEDLIWAKKLQEKNYYFKYTCGAEVYHYHGIHQHKLNNSSDRLSNSLGVLLKTGWLQIDFPEFCDYRSQTCLFKDQLTGKSYLAKSLENKQYKFMPIHEQQENIDLTSVDYFLFTSARFDEQRFISAFREVAMQTSQVSIMSQNECKHNLQETIKLNKLKKLIAANKNKLIFISKCTSDKLLGHHG